MRFARLAVHLLVLPQLLSALQPVGPAPSCRRVLPLRSRPLVAQTGSNDFIGELQNLWGAVTGTPTGAEEATAGPLVPEDRPIAEELEGAEYIPLVLVIGATGRTGRIIVRKLLLRGFRVAVLVRSLSSETLNLFGSGVSYSYGDMTDYKSLLDAMEDVDKVVFVAESAEKANQEKGLRNIVRSLQDTRTFTYGDAEATKSSLFKFRRKRDFGMFEMEASGDDISERLAAAGLSSRPSVAYWKRSEAHSNAVFVGTVFDRYLGSAVVSSDLRTSLSSAYDAIDTVSADAIADQEDDDFAAPPEGTSLSLGEFSGLLIKCIGDGQLYTAVLRTSLYESDGVEYQYSFPTTAGSWIHARLPFSGFVPHRGGRRVPVGDLRNQPALAELDRRNLIGLAFAYYPQQNFAAKKEDDKGGSFYISIAHIKAYRQRDEPDVVYISSAAAEAAEEQARLYQAREQRKLAARQAVADATGTPAMELPEQSAAAPWAEPAGEEAVSAAAGEAAATASEGGARSDSEAEAGGGSAVQADLLDRFSKEGQEADPLACERTLRASGLTYFIVRPAMLDDGPGGERRIDFSQGGAPPRGSVSRSDVAEVVVRSLLDPRACNVATTLSESRYLPGAGESKQDISKMLELLLPEGSVGTE